MLSYFPELDGDPIVKTDNVLAAADVFQQFQAGTFYMRNEAAFRSMGWHSEADKVKPLADEERARFTALGKPIPEITFDDEPERKGW